MQKFLSKNLIIVFVLAALVAPVVSFAQKEDAAAVKVKSFFSTLDTWRVKELTRFQELKERQEQILHDQDVAKSEQLKNLDVLEPDTLPTTNYISKGDSGFIARPVILAKIYFFSLLIFIFGSAMVFYFTLGLIIFLIARYFWMHFF